MPLGDRKEQLATLLGRRRIGIAFRTDQDGALLFVHVCRMGFEGSSQSASPDRPGPSQDWSKVKNRIAQL